MNDRTGKPMRRRAAASALVLLFTVAAAAEAQRQSVPRGEGRGQGPRIGRLEVTVEDLATGRMLDPIAPKDTLVIEVGQRVRLRMTAYPVNGGPPRYPSTSFQPNDSRHLRIDRINTEVGTIQVTGLRPHGPNGAVPIIYQIQDSWPMPEDLRSARIYVQVAGREVVDPTPPPAQRGSVTLFQDDDFRGRSQEFWESSARLTETAIGNDTVSSIRVSPGCRVYLYEHDNYRGRVSVLESDVRTLRGSEVGNDSVSSFRIECRGSGGGRGVTLFADDDFRGASETFELDDPNLADNSRIGNDRASSVRVDGGCEAWLYADRDYQGPSLYVTGDVGQLGRTAIGNDRVSSVRVRCR